MLSLHMLPGTDKNNLVHFLLGHICVTSILWKMICFSLDKTATFLRFAAMLFYVKRQKLSRVFSIPWKTISHWWWSWNYGNRSPQNMEFQHYTNVPFYGFTNVLACCCRLEFCQFIDAFVIN